MGKDEIAILPLETLDQFQQCEKVQHIVWQSNLVDVVPSHLMITFQRHGGLVLGAFDTAGEMVGCLLGFAGRTAPENPITVGVRWQHCSHMVGVIPAWQGKGVGYRLKLAQREWAVRHGFAWATWTFDPLEAVNGILNLGKLGTICRCYLRNVYGELVDGLNAGLPTDRFEVAWPVGSERVRERVEQGWHPPALPDLLDAGVRVLNPGQIGVGGQVEPGLVQSPEGKQLLIEIPARFQAIKAAGLDQALAWRLNVRAACEAAFEAGYTVWDVVRGEVAGIGRVYYLLARGMDPAAL